MTRYPVQSISMEYYSNRSRSEDNQQNVTVNPTEWMNVIIYGSIETIKMISIILNES